MICLYMEFRKGINIIHLILRKEQERVLWVRRRRNFKNGKIHGHVHSHDIAMRLIMNTIWSITTSIVMRHTHEHLAMVCSQPW